MLQVRRACLNTLQILREKAQDSNITYLKNKNILPLFYYFLQDSSAEIREVAVNCLKKFGPQAELIFIEGLTKDKNPQIRSECAKGLGALGPQNLRALLFGLRDIEEPVRKATTLAIRSNFTTDSIVEEFKDKQNKVPALLCSIKEIIQLPFIMNEKTRSILEQVLVRFGEAPQSKKLEESNR